MGLSFRFVKMGVLLIAISVLGACVAKQDLILPNKQQRITRVERYKQCVANATNQHVFQNRQPEAIVRDSMNKCRPAKYTMLNEYPKGWRKNYEKKIDQEVLKQEIAYVIKARQQQVRR
ncbi:MAG: hypothetical protein PVJ39_11285 [Gammaproteobacteria bacterium]|jgi:hypothetical protein